MGTETTRTAKRRIRNQFTYNKQYREYRREDGMRYMPHKKCYSKIEPCEVCGDRDIDVIAAHHIVPAVHTLGEKYNRENGGILFLCQNCHKKLHRIYGGIGKVPYTGPTDKSEIINTVRKARARGKMGIQGMSKLAEESEFLPLNKRNKIIQNLFMTGKMTVNDIAREYKLQGPTIRKIIKSGHLGRPSLIDE